jgi:hypothetical protein
VLADWLAGCSGPVMPVWLGAVIFPGLFGLTKGLENFAPKRVGLFGLPWRSRLQAALEQRRGARYHNFSL